MSSVSTAPAGMTVCGGNNPMAQLTVTQGFAVNITFPGTPPFRLAASPYRNGTTVCPTHVQNITTNTFTWVVDISTNSTLLRTITGQSNSPASNQTPVFQLGDAVQWVAHEQTAQPNGQYRYYNAEANYTVTSLEKSLADQRARSGGLRVAKTGVLGWVVGALLLSGMVAASV